MNCCIPTEKQAKYLNDLKTKSIEKIKIAKQNLEKFPVESTGNRRRIQDAITELEKCLNTDPEKNAVPVSLLISMFNSNLNNIWLNHTPENPVA